MSPSLILQPKARKALEALEKAWKAQGGFVAPDASPGAPPCLPLASIELLPMIFQRRPGRNPVTGVVAEDHVRTLVSALKGSPGALLDPVTILKVDNRNILIEGHHRINAYKMFERISDIPVCYFEGSPKKALIEAGRENGKARLQMSKAECSENAWGLVVGNLGFTNEEISFGSGVTSRTIRTMQARYREFIDAGEKPSKTWMEARGRHAPIDDRLDEQTTAMVRKLEKALGSPVAFSPGRVWLLSRALLQWGPQVAENLYRQLEQDLDFDDDEEIDEDEYND